MLRLFTQLLIHHTIILKHVFDVRVSDIIKIFEIKRLVEWRFLLFVKPNYIN